jgi:hypothetical protein
VIGADRLEDDVKVASAADLRAKEGEVKITRAEVMNDCGLLIEQRLDVDDLQRPVLLAADSLADLISLGPKLRRAAGIFQVLSTGETQYTGPSRSRVPGRRTGYRTPGIVVAGDRG